MGEDIFEGDAERSHQEPWQAWQERRAGSGQRFPKDRRQARVMKRQQQADKRQQQVEAFGQRTEKWLDDKERRIEEAAHRAEAKSKEAAQRAEAKSKEPRQPRQGLITKGKAHTARTDARRAFAEGHTLFAYQLAGRLFDWFGSVTGYAEQLEAIEAEGWHLEHISYAGGTKGDAVQIALFRRVETP